MRCQTLILLIFILPMISHARFVPLFSSSSIESNPTQVPQKKVTHQEAPIPYIVHESPRASARAARALKIPNRVYNTTVNAKLIAEKYASALQPTPYQNKRTALPAILSKLQKIEVPPSPIPYEILVRRMDALFSILDNHYAIASTELWQLSQETKEPYQDLFFSGISAERGGWEFLATNLFLQAIEQKLATNERYLNLLWKELDQFREDKNISVTIQKIMAQKLNLLPRAGDKANYFSALYFLNQGQDIAPWKESISHTHIAKKIDLAQALYFLEQNEPVKAKESLLSLAENAPQELQNEIHFSLARIAMQEKHPEEALEHYQLIKIDGANRMDLLLEKSYAHLKLGNFNEAIGKSIGLESPYFQYGFAPEAFFLEALSRKSNCDYNGANIALEKFQKNYSEERKAISAWLENKTMRESRYESLINFYNEAHPMRFQRHLLAIPQVILNQHNLNARQQEWKALQIIGQRKYQQPLPKDWNVFLRAQQRKSLEVEEKIEKESVDIAELEALHMKKKLENAFEQLELLKVDIATQANEEYQVQSALNFPARKIASLPRPKDKIQWPFADEIWEDELDDLVAKNPSRCASR